MLRIKDMCIDLDGTVTCGQIFRYEKEADNSYTIILSDRVINIKKDNIYLIILKILIFQENIKLDTYYIFSYEQYLQSIDSIPTCKSISPFL